MESLLNMDRASAIAMLLMAFSAFIYSLQSLNVKLLGDDYRFWTISFFRGVTGTVASLASGAANRKNREGPLWGSEKNRRWLIIRGLLGGITIITAFAAISVRPIHPRSSRFPCHVSSN
jgi:drug/metabolite transporter (DMT)-like permease